MIEQHKETGGGANEAPGAQQEEERRRCQSGTDCPAYPEIGHAENLARGNGQDFCYRCRTRLADETTKDLDARRLGADLGAAAARRRRRRGSGVA